MSARSAEHRTAAGGGHDGARELGDDAGLWRKMQGLLRPFRRRDGDETAKDPLEELIEEREEAEIPLGEDERLLLANILELRNRSAEDVMVPRADIVAADRDASLHEVVELMTKSGHSRIPVYRETLDDALGMIHIKDILAWRCEGDQFRPAKVLRQVLFIAPSMEVLELLLEMRVKRCHMALVVDEFGGVDGLVTIEDVVEEIVGEIEDEHSRGSEPNIVVRADGSIDMDARAPVESIAEHFAGALSEEEQEDIDTVGGLVVSVAGRVPIRGELITHPAGLEFEVLDADPRRLKRLRVRHAEQATVSAQGSARAGEPDGPVG